MRQRKGYPNPEAEVLQSLLHAGGAVGRSRHERRAGGQGPRLDDRGEVGQRAQVVKGQRARRRPRGSHEQPGRVQLRRERRLGLRVLRDEVQRPGDRVPCGAAYGVRARTTYSPQVPPRPPGVAGGAPGRVSVCPAARRRALSAVSMIGCDAWRLAVRRCAAAGTTRRHCVSMLAGIMLRAQTAARLWSPCQQ